MYQKFTKTIKNLLSGQTGMTGLETAIILIAFVTVASVLAYSVLSAGIFSAEKGKSTVYSGLQSAQASLETKGTVLGETDGTKLTTVNIKLGLVDPNEAVDTNAIHVTFIAANVSEQIDPADAVFTLISTERGSTNMVERDEVWNLAVAVPDDATIGAYQSFSIQIIPPTGAALQVQRTMPGALTTELPLN